MSTTPNPLQSRIAALSRDDLTLLARRATVSVRTLQNIIKGLHKQHPGTVRNIERALGRMQMQKPATAQGVAGPKS